MKENFKKLYETVDGAIKKILATEESSIDKAAQLVASSIERDQLVHIIGTGGHSQMGAMEMFWRAGCLAPMNPLLDPSLLPSMGAKHSNWMERTEGLAPSILSAYEVASGETIIIVNAYGINPVTIDTALESKKRGLNTIGITSTSFAEKVPAGVASRHSTGKNLHEIVDVFINCYMPLGDASVQIEGCAQAVAPVSTILNSFCLHLLVIATVEKLVKAGIEPPLWMSANLPEGDETNKRWHARYNPRVKHLR
ncbi:MAG: SIS domain-containing protein [Spirochaetales bacterium]|nr:SIS domain-containing protein [Spirochaetales bacterium]